MFTFYVCCPQFAITVSQCDIELATLQFHDATLKFDNTVVFHAKFQLRIFSFTDFTPTVAAAFNSFVSSFARAFFPVIFAFLSYISLSRNQYSVRFFCIMLFCFSPFLHSCNLAHFIISIATFQCSRSNLSSTSVSSFFLLPSHTTFVSIVYFRLVISVSSLYSLITCNLSYFILFCL